jgi:hypothetical protein
LGNGDLGILPSEPVRKRVKHAEDGLREVVDARGDWPAVASDLPPLAVFAVVLVPLTPRLDGPALLVGEFGLPLEPRDDRHELLVLHEREVVLALALVERAGKVVPREQRLPGFDEFVLS